MSPVKAVKRLSFFLKFVVRGMSTQLVINFHVDYQTSSIVHSSQGKRKKLRLLSRKAMKVVKGLVSR